MDELSACIVRELPACLAAAGIATEVTVILTSSAPLEAERLANLVSWKSRGSPGSLTVLYPLATLPREWKWRSERDQIVFLNWMVCAALPFFSFFSFITFLLKD